MPLALDQIRPKSHKTYESELQLKLDTSKQCFADPKDIWQIKSVCSGVNNSEDEEKCRKFHIKCGENTQYEKTCSKQKNLLFGRSDSSTVDDTEYSETDEQKFCSEVKEAEETCWSRNHEGSCGKCCVGRGENPRRVPKEETDRVRRSEGRYSGCGSHDCVRWEENKHRCGDWCSRYHSEDLKSGVSVRALRHAKPYKHVHHARREDPTKGHIHQMSKVDSDCYRQDICDHFKQKKKILGSYEKLPVVDEIQEQLSDATYKKSHSAFLDASDPLSNFPQDETCAQIKEVIDRGPSWFPCDNKPPESTFSENISYGIHSERTVKTRSRRTKMNRSRRNRWAKAYIHTVLEKTRNEIVGIMVMGPRGPEYYSTSSALKPCYIPFRKSRSFPEGPTKSFISLASETKDVCLSASDPGQKPSSPFGKLIPPEEDTKIAEAVSNFDENLEDMVKSTEQRVLHTLTKDHTVTPRKSSPEEKPKPKSPEAQAENLEELKKMKYPPFHLMPFELLSARVPKSMRRNKQVIAFNVESKTLAENLNEQSKQFRPKQNDLSPRLSELEKSFPPKSLDKNTTDANLSLWGMKLDESELMEGGRGDGNDSHRDYEREEILKKSSDCGDHDRNKCEIHAKDKQRLKFFEDDPEEGISGSPRKVDESSENRSKNRTESEQMLYDLFKDLVQKGCAISEKQSEALQQILRNAANEVELRSTSSIENRRRRISKKTEEGRPSSKKNRDRKRLPAQKIKLLREALPSMAAENEAAHLKQLKKYIHRFIDRVELKTSSSELRARRRVKSRVSTSSDGSEIKVDAQKLIDLVSNPLKKMTSDVTVDVAKKLTDALVQETSSKTCASSPRKNSEGTEDDASAASAITFSSDRGDEVEPVYLKQLKKMRNDHLSNIKMEVRRLTELLRFLDKCSRLKL